MGNAVHATSGHVSIDLDVNAKGSLQGRLLNKEDAKNACVDEAAEEIVPRKAAENGGEDEPHEKNDL